MKLNPSVHMLVKSFHLEMLKRCFTTVLVFLLLCFYEYIIISSLSVLSLPWFILFSPPSLEFSWDCSVFSTRTLRLSNRVLRQKTLKQHWKRQEYGTDKEYHKAVEE